MSKIEKLRIIFDRPSLNSSTESQRRKYSSISQSNHLPPSLSLESTNFEIISNTPNPQETINKWSLEIDSRDRKILELETKISEWTRESPPKEEDLKSLNSLGNNIDISHEEQINELIVDNCFKDYLLSKSIQLTDIIAKIDVFFPVLMKTVCFKSYQLSYPINVMNSILQYFFYITYDSGQINLSNLANNVYRSNLLDFFTSDFKPGNPRTKHKNIWTDKYQDYYTRNEEKIQFKKQQHQKKCIADIEKLLIKCNECYSRYNRNIVMYGSNELVLFSKNSDVYSYVNTLKNTVTLKIDLSKINTDASSLLMHKLCADDTEISKLEFSHNLNQSYSVPKVQFNLFNVIIYRNIKKISFINTNFSCSESFSFVTILLTTLPNIASFSLKQCGLTDGNIETLFTQLIATDKQIKHINWSNNKITGWGAFFITKYIKILSSWDYLNIASNEITQNGLKTIWNMILETGKSWRKFNLSFNNLSTEDMNNICDFWSKNPKIGYLNLSGNHLDMQSSLWMGCALPKINRCESINLSAMKILCEMTPTLFEADVPVREIILDDNWLGEIGVVGFSKVLRKNTTLRRISLRNCFITAFGLGLLWKELVVNERCCVEELCLECNWFNEQALNEIVKFCGKKGNVKVFLSKWNGMETGKVKDVKNLIWVDK